MKNDIMTIDLTDRQKMLLQMYSDGECGRFKAFLARRLLNKSDGAREYLDELVQISQETSLQICNNAAGGVDLWDKINNRIEQEEKAELYLGKREVKKAEKSFFRKYLQVTPGYALGGSVVAASLLFFTVGYYQGGAGTPLSVDSRAVSVMNGSAAPSQVVPVSTGGQSISRQPFSPSHGITTPRDVPVVNVASTGKRAVPPAAHSKGGSSFRNVEVDWLKSDGRLRLIQSPEKKSFIIWVRNRDKTTDYNLRDNFAPLDNPQSGNIRQADEEIRIIESRIPHAITVKE